MLRIFTFLLIEHFFEVISLTALFDDLYKSVGWGAPPGGSFIAIRFRVRVDKLDLKAGQAGYFERRIKVSGNRGGTELGEETAHLKHQSERQIRFEK